MNLEMILVSNVVAAFEHRMWKKYKLRVVRYDVCDIGCYWKKWGCGGGIRCREGIGLVARASEA